MLTQVDRLQVAVADRRDAVECYERLFDARRLTEDRVAWLGAERTVLRLGSSEVEVLEPHGVGRVADFLGRSGPGLFAAGFATPDLGALAAHLRGLGRCVDQEGDQLFLSAAGLGLPGLHAVITREEERKPAGLLRGVYEVTSLASDADDFSARAARLLGLDPAHFTPIHSEAYGYDGVLMLFRPDALHRIEVVSPFDDAKTMGRYFRRKGPRYYMAYAEADDTSAVRERLRELAPRHWTGSEEDTMPDNLFVHPAALAGVMLGVSRKTFAWSWSGHPERVQPPSAP
jgi:hypothetical protein